MWWLSAHMQPSSTSTSFFIAVLGGVVAGAHLLGVPGCGRSLSALSSEGGHGGTGGFAPVDGGKIACGTPQCSAGLDNHGDGKSDYDGTECVGGLHKVERSYAR